MIKKIIFLIFLLLLAIRLLTFSYAQTASNATASLDVNFKYNTLNVSLSQMNASIVCSRSRTDSFNVSAAYPGNTGLDVLIGREGSIAGWITFNGALSKTITLASGETKEVNFTVTIPQTNSSGSYSANITLISADGQTKKINLTVNVTVTVSWDNFKNNLTTNFSALNETELAAVGNATIGILEKGLINFTGQTIDFRGADLDSFINISANLIALDTSNLSDLNVPAILTLYNLAYNNPRILRDGAACSSLICTKISYVGGTLIFNVTSFANYSAGDYCGNGYCEDDESSTTCSADCVTLVAPPGGGGGGAPPVKKPVKGEVGINFISWQVLREVATGQSITLGIAVKNMHTKGVALKARISGIPTEWVSILPEELPLDVQAEGGFTITISVPDGIKVGDYKASIIVSNTEAYGENSFILRVKKLVPEYDKPIVMRAVEIDREEQKTNVRLKVSNPSKQILPLVEVIEYIPKDLANNSKFINFDTTPSRILSADPIVQWDLLNFNSSEDITVAYSVKKILPEFTPYVYWPLQQLNVIKQKSPILFKLVSLDIPALKPGKTSAASLIIENLDTIEHKFKFMLELPSDWEMRPAKIEEVIKGGERKEFNLQLYTPPEAEKGTYIIRAVFEWDGNIVIREHPITVKIFQKTLTYIFVALLILAVIVQIIIHKRIKKERYFYPKIRRAVLRGVWEQIKGKG